MYTKIRIDFMFQDFDKTPQEVSKAIGINSDKAHMKGETLERNPKVKWKNNTWLISSKVNEKEPFETHLDDIIKKIDSRFENFISISKTCNTYLNCVISMYDGDRPFINFNRKQLKILNELNAEIEFDIYNFQSK